MGSAELSIHTYILKYNHVSAVLQELHWLPIRLRIHFKISTLTFKALKGGES